MPPASGRYQSRLFNFISRQSQRWGDRVGETLRHVKLKAGWSLQSFVFAIVSPIHRAIDNAGKQIAGRQTQADVPKLNPECDRIFPDADVPVLNSLGKARTFGSYKHHAAFTGSTNLVTKTTIIQSVPHLRGIATQLADRSLVLVNSANEILNILTPQEQQKLLDQIISETADYYTARSQFEGKVKEHTCALAEIDQILTKLTGDNSQSSQLQLPPPQPNAHSAESVEFHPPHSLELIDAALAKFEESAVVPVARTTTSLVHKIATQIHTLVYGHQVDRVSHDSSVITNQSPQQIPVNHQSKAEIGLISKLIWDAINYFFGQDAHPSLRDNVQDKLNHQNNLAGRLSNQPLLNQNIDNKIDNTTTKNTRAKTVANSIIDQTTDETAIDDPWLTANELFGQVIPVITTNIIETESSTPISSTSSISELAQQQAEVKQIQGESISPQLLKPQQSSIKISQSQVSQSIITSIHKSTSIQPSNLPGTKNNNLYPQATNPIKKTLVTSSHQTSIIQDKHRASNEFINALDTTELNELDYTPDWIEINASTVSYEKHPLEQILEWLDQLMAWLEAKLVTIIKSIWNWWQSRN